MDDESVRTLDTLCITHPVQPSTTTLLSTHRIAHHTTTQSAAIRESIVSPVANWSPLADDTNTPNVHSPTHVELLDAALLRPVPPPGARARSDDRMTCMIDDHVWRDASLIQRLRRRRSVVADDTTGSCLACCLATEKKMGRSGFFRVDPGGLG